MDREGVIRGSFDATLPDGNPNDEVVQQVLTGVGGIVAGTAGREMTPLLRLNPGGQGAN